MSFAFNLLIGIDQPVNVLLAGAPDETLSSPAHRMRAEGRKHLTWVANLIDTCSSGKRVRCEAAWLPEVQRQQLPASMRACSYTVRNP